MDNRVRNFEGLRPCCCVLYCASSSPKGLCRVVYRYIDWLGIAPGNFSLVWFGYYATLLDRVISLTSTCSFHFA